MRLPFTDLLFRSLQRSGAADAPASHKDAANVAVVSLTVHKQSQPGHRRHVARRERTVNKNFSTRSASESSGSAKNEGFQPST